MVDVSQVPGDAPRAIAVKLRKQKSALADIVTSLVVILLMTPAIRDDIHLNAQLLELQRRLRGNP